MSQGERKGTKIIYIWKIVEGFKVIATHHPILSSHTSYTPVEERGRICYISHLMRAQRPLTNIRHNNISQRLQCNPSRHLQHHQLHFGFIQEKVGSISSKTPKSTTFQITPGSATTAFRLSFQHTKMPRVEPFLWPESSRAN